MKTVVFYYTQSGQALEAVKNICDALRQNNKEEGMVCIEICLCGVRYLA